MTRRQTYELYEAMGCNVTMKLIPGPYPVCLRAHKWDHKCPDIVYIVSVYNSDTSIIYLNIFISFLG